VALGCGDGGSRGAAFDHGPKGSGFEAQLKLSYFVSFELEGRGFEATLFW